MNRGKVANEAVLDRQRRRERNACGSLPSDCSFDEYGFCVQIEVTNVDMNVL